MPKHSLAEQLDTLIDSVIAAPRGQSLSGENNELIPFVPVARVLHNLPRPDFKQILKSDLLRMEPMKDDAAVPTPTHVRPSFVRPGFNNIAPYIVVDGATDFIAFLQAAFEGAERIRMPRPDGKVMHAQVDIGNSAVEVGDVSAEHPARPCTVHLYAGSADQTYALALKAGATSIYPVADQPWGDRQGCVKDEFGNVWYIAMPNGWDPGPEGVRNIQPFLHLRNASSMIPFLQEAFEAEVLGMAKSDEGELLHSTVKIGVGTVEINEAHGDAQPMPSYLHVYVPDVDDLYGRALKAGAQSVESPSTKPYGERSAAVRDPFGNTWYLATYLEGAKK